MSKFLLLGLTCSACAAGLRHQRRETTVIPADSFSSLDTYWNYHYPWGTDHNGAARMDEAHVQVEDGTLVLTAEPVEGEPPAHHGGNDIPIKYLSGAVHSKDTFTVQAGGGYDFSGEFVASTERGTWPAFWLNGAESWPPEIDIAEWKGSGDISFNTFNTSSEVTSLDVPYPNEGEWHSVTCEIRDVNGADISVRFIMDGEEVATQYGGDYVGKPLHLIINYQMEGSSGTTYSIRNVEVVNYNL
ncbi:hypothetical protein VUR80DRAFT_3586 [Thermomyces stellatus]